MKDSARVLIGGIVGALVALAFIITGATLSTWLHK